MAVNNKPASAYAKPHTMGGKIVTAKHTGRPAKLSELDMSVGNIDKSGGAETTKTRGIKIRGTGAATKGTTARGPMA